jgi:hypothetical protein
MKTREQTKHTPGEWRIAELHAQGLYLNDGGINILTDSGSVCTVHLQVSAKRGEAYKAKDPERDANARLIAAAPDLLYALQQIVSDLPSNRDWLSPDLERAARAAIAKATN